VAGMLRVFLQFLQLFRAHNFLRSKDSGMECTILRICSSPRKTRLSAIGVRSARARGVCFGWPRQAQIAPLGPNDKA
jgi:hypothetical protein